MLDIYKLREEYEKISKRIRDRNRPYEQLDEFLKVDEEWRNIATKTQELRTKRNSITEQISKLYAQGKKAEGEKLRQDVIGIKEQLESLEKKYNDVHANLMEVLYSIPNIPDPEVPLGKDENDNVELRKINKPKKFKFKVLPHWELAEHLDIADFTRAAKISGSRHTIFKGDGARLMRALRNYTLDIHQGAGFIELQPPVLINPEILYGTGHLPKSKDDMFELKNGQFLSPTEEIPLTGYYRNETLNINQLPIRLSSSTISYRSEAGSAGKDMRGVIRQHQFYNTEMVVICSDDDSKKQHEFITKQAELILKSLKLPYRVIILCTGDMGSAATKTYDIEVWFPYEQKYREISSCSNCRDYQARGSVIKYIDQKTNETKFVHTLNGTGTSLNRLWVAVVENYQQQDGSIVIPTALQKYMNGQKIIKPVAVKSVKKPAVKKAIVKKNKKK